MVNWETVLTALVISVLSNLAVFIFWMGKFSQRFSGMEKKVNEMEKQHKDCKDRCDTKFSEHANTNASLNNRVGIIEQRFDDFKELLTNVSNDIKDMRRLLYESITKR